MREDPNTDPENNPESLPAEWPCEFADALRFFIPADSITERLMRIRRFIEHDLSKRRLATPANVRSAFLARQRKPFVDEDEYRAYRDNFLAWWEGHLSSVRRKARIGGKST